MPICLDRADAARSRLLTKPFVLTMLAEFALCMSIGMLLAVVPVYAHDDLGVGSFGVALAVAAVSPMVLVCQPLAGRFGDRRGRKLLIVAGGAIAALAVAGYVVADSLPLLVALRLLTGAGEALLLVGAATMITDLAPEHRRGEALSLFSLGLWGGLALGPILGELVLGDDRFDAVWLFAAACCLASALIGLTLPETAPLAGPDHRTTARLVHPAADRAGCRARASRVLGFAGIGTFGALYARELGLDGAGSVFLVFSAVVVATRVLARQVPDRLGPKRTARVALSLIAAGPPDDRGLERSSRPVRRDRSRRRRSCARLPVADDAGRERGSSERTQLGRRHVQRLHGAGLPRRRSEPRRHRFDGGVRRRVRRLRVRAAPRGARALPSHGAPTRRASARRGVATVAVRTARRVGDCASAGGSLPGSLVVLDVTLFNGDQSWNDVCAWRRTVTSGSLR